MQHPSSLVWADVSAQITCNGYALVRALMTRAECTALRQLLDQKQLFARYVTMEDKGYGKGRYGYFAAPLPWVADLRAGFYKGTKDLANAYARAAQDPRRTFGVESYPETFAEFSHQCQDAGQIREGSLLLSYPEGGYNELHQDKYGKQQIVYPFQAVVQLTAPEEDFQGGAFVLEEGAMQRRIQPDIGDLVVFPSVFTPGRGRARHGVDKMQGHRATFGVFVQKI